MSKIVYLADIDYSYLDLQFQNLDNLHNRISTGMYHAVAIQQSEIKTYKEKLQYVTQQLYGWGQNLNYILGTNPDFIRKKNYSNYKNLNTEDNEYVDTQININEIREKNEEEEESEQNSDEDDFSSYNSSQFGEISDDSQNILQNQNKSSQIKEIQIVFGQDDQEYIKYIPLSISSGIHHTAILAIPENDLLNLHYNIQGKIDKQEINYSNLWNRIYKKTRVFTNGLSDNKRLGYYVKCQNCQGKSELKQGKLVLEGFFCDVCQKRTLKNNDPCFRCKCQHCNFDVCQKCYLQNPYIECQVCQKKNNLKEVINPYIAKQMLKICNLCTEQQCDCESCNRQTKIKLLQNSSIKKYCQNSKCQQILFQIQSEFLENFNQIIEKKEERLLYQCSKIKEGVSQCNGKETFFRCYDAIQEKQSETSLDNYNNQNNICDGCQNVQKYMIQQFQNHEFYKINTKVNNGCSYTDNIYKYYCDYCNKRFPKSQEVYKCFLCNSYYVCKNCYSQGINVCQQFSCKNEGNTLKANDSTQVNFKGQLIIKEIDLNRCCPIVNSQKGQQNYFICSCSKFPYKLCSKSCYHKEFLLVYYNNNKQKIEQLEIQDNQIFNRELNQFMTDLRGFICQDIEQQESISDFVFKLRKKINNNNSFESDEYENFCNRSQKFVYFPFYKQKKCKEGVLQIACGYSFTLALTTYGNVYAWGQGTHGGLGNGLLSDIGTPNQIKFENDDKIIFISAGALHAGCINKEGQIYVWGSSQHGQVGADEIGVNYSTPQKIQGQLVEKSISYLSCGGYHTSVTTQDGYVFTWGLNNSGQLGHNDFQIRRKPTLVQACSNYFALKSICGTDNTFILMENGLEFAFGDNFSNKLGLQDQIEQQRQKHSQPQLINQLFYKNTYYNINIYQIVSSKYITMTLLADGHLLSVGLDINGLLGRYKNVEQKLKDDSFDGVEKVESDDEVQQKLLQDKTNFNDNDQQNDENEENNQFRPGVIKIRNINQFLSQQNNNMSMNDNRNNNLTYNLNNDTEWIEIFVPSFQFRKGSIQSQKNVDSPGIQQVKCGIYHTMVLTKMGQILIFGSNNSGQHGMSQIEKNAQINANYFEEFKIKVNSQSLSLESLPTMIKDFSIKNNRIITSISCGYEYCMAVENRRAVYAWGKNSDGQLGIGSINQFSYKPTQVQGLNGNLIRQIACGETHSLFLTEKGQAYACGNPDYGKLGIGTRTTISFIPQLILGLQEMEVIKIAAGQSHSMAIAVDPDDISNEKSKQKKMFQKNILFTWGSGWDSKLGHGNQENQWHPKKVQTSVNFTEISAGFRHSCALDEEGYLYIWGPYECFQISKPDFKEEHKQNLTQNSNLDINFQDQNQTQQVYEFDKPVLHPEFVKSDTKFKQVCLFDKYSLALDNQDRLYMWGEFDQHIQQIKMEKGHTNMEQFNIKKMDENFCFEQIICSRNHAAGLQNGWLYTWGIDNNIGRLGLGYQYYDKKLVEQENLNQQIDQKQIEEASIYQDLTQLFSIPQNCSYLNKYLHNINIMQTKQLALNQNDRFLQNRKKQDQIKKGISYFGKSMEKSNKSNQIMSLSQSYQMQISKQKIDLDQQQNIQNSIKVYQKSGLEIEQWISQLNLRINKKSSILQFISQTTDGIPDLYECLQGEYKYILDDQYLLYIQQRVNEQIKKVQLYYQKYKNYQLDYDKFQQETSSVIYKRVKQSPFKISYEIYEDYFNKEIENQYMPFMHLQDPYRYVLTSFQVHPCYCYKLYKFIKKKNDTDLIQQYKQFISELFGELENSFTKQMTLIQLSKMILKKDIKHYLEARSTLKKKIKFTLNLDKEKCISQVFVHIFQVLINSFTQNKLAKLKLREYVDKQIDMISTHTYQQDEKQISLAFRQEDCEGYFRSRGNVLTEEQKKIFMNRRIDDLIQAIQGFFYQLNLHQINYTMSNFFQLPEQIVQLICDAKIIIKQKIPNLFEDELDTKFLELALLNFISDKQRLDQFSISEQENEQRILMRMNYKYFYDGLQLVLQGNGLDMNIYPYAQKFNQFIKNDKYRIQLFQILIGKNIKALEKNQQFDDNCFQIEQMYKESQKLQDDTVIISINSLIMLTNQIWQSQFRKNQNGNPLCVFVQNDMDIIQFFIDELKESNYETYKDNIYYYSQFGQNTVSVKLLSRQLFYEDNQNIKKCQNCDCYLHESYLNIDDPELIHNYEQLNPSSIESLFLQIAILLDKTEFEKLKKGQYDFYNQLEFHIKNQNWQMVKIMKDFIQVYQQNIKVKIQDQKDADEIFQEEQIKLSIIQQVIKKLEERKIKLFKYLNKLEQILISYTQIENFYPNNKEYQQKVQKLKAIQRNCFLGLANKGDVQKDVENLPDSKFSQILQSMNDIKISDDFYQCIEQFERKSIESNISHAKKQFSIMQDPEMKIKNNNIEQEKTFEISTFGGFSYQFLNKKGAIFDITNEMCLKINSLLGEQNYSKQTIVNRLLYIFKQKVDNRFEGKVIYSESDIKLSYFLSCGIIKKNKPKKFLVEAFDITQQDILNLRQKSFIPKSKNKSINFGQTIFLINGLCQVLNDIENQSQIYQYTFENNYEKNKKSELQKEKELEQKKEQYNKLKQAQIEQYKQIQ